MNKIYLLIMVLSTSLFSQVIINEHYSYPDELEISETIQWNTNSSSEYISFKVQGEIIDFTVSVANFDNETFEMSQGEQLYYIEKVSNRTILLKTGIPEGIPYEMITWKNSQGKEFRKFIQSSGMGGEVVIPID